MPDRHGMHPSRIGRACAAGWALAFLAGAPLHAQDFGRRERTFDATHYRIEVRFDEPARTVYGAVTIDFAPIRPDFRMLELDAVAMTIEGVTSRSGRPLAFDYDSTKLRVHLERPYRIGEATAVTVRYHCTPRRGLYFVAPSDSYPDDPSEIWTQGQGEDNRCWIPCYDYPNDKATSEVIMTVRSEYETLSNGALVSRKKNRDGTTTWHWRMDQPHSTYLIMLAAGRYAVYEDSWDGIPVRGYHYPSDLASDARRTYETTAEMVKFYSTRTGIRYPWPKYAQISVAHFMYGGMENTTATVMNDTRMVTDARAALDYTPDGLIAHELAHQWWGDYVTYIDWDNAWLNEGFATYFQQCWTEYKWGRDEFALQRMDGIDSYLHWCDAAGRVPVVTHRSNGGANIYSKGAAVLHMIRSLLGEDLFWRAIHAYGDAHAFGNVETNDLKRAIEDVTGVDLYWFFDQWLYKAGYPDLQVTKSWDAATRTLALRFRQVQKPDSLCGTFRLPVPVRIATAAGPLDTTLRIAGADSTVLVPLPAAPETVAIDPDGVICGRIALEEPVADDVALLRHGTGVPVRIRAGLALVERAADPAARGALFDAVRHDPFHGVRERIAARLAELDVDTVPYAAELNAVFVDLTKDSSARVRAIAITGLNRYRDAHLRSIFERMLSDSSYYTEAAAMNALLSVDSTTTMGVVRTRLHERAWRDIPASAALDWVIRYRWKALRPDVLALAGPGGTPQLRAKAWEALAAIGTSGDELESVIASALDESARDVRLNAVGAAVALIPSRAAELLIRREKIETDDHVLRAIRHALGEKD